MSSKVLIIIATGDKEKARSGLLYAYNVLKEGWLEDAKVVFFGPSEKLIVQDEQLANQVKDIAAVTETFACKFISDEDAISGEVKKLGVKVEYVGKTISNFIKDGYLPMIW